MESLDTSQIKDWRSIVTLVVFVLTNLAVLFPFHIPIYFPQPCSNAILDVLSALRVISPRKTSFQQERKRGKSGKLSFIRLHLPINFITAPLIADLFLLAILAIGRQEVHDGTIGVDNISPIDIMAFFLTLAYIAISIDASGLIRYLAFKVVQKGGKLGHRLFFYLYAFFFGLGSFIGNDPIILSGTAFLAYMTRVSSNIIHPRAWIHTQFAIANIASAILVSSNPTNLVLAGAFKIRFVTYTANMIVPVVVTAIVLFPFLLYIVFANEDLIPLTIKIHELPEEVRHRKPINPNIPNARGDDENEKLAETEKGKLLSLEEVMNPFLDKGGAAFGAVIMAVTLVTLLALNAAAQSKNGYPVFWVTLPAAFVMFCWDLGFGWIHRHETREISRKGREQIERARVEQAIRLEEAMREQEQEDIQGTDDFGLRDMQPSDAQLQSRNDTDGEAVEEPTDDGVNLPTDDKETAAPSSSRPSSSGSRLVPKPADPQDAPTATQRMSAAGEARRLVRAEQNRPSEVPAGSGSNGETDEEKRAISERVSSEVALQQKGSQATLVSLTEDLYRWSQETFPTVMAVLSHLPFALVPFALSMFVLVQALVTKGWVQVFAYGWDHWVTKTGTLGSIGGIGFLSVILCNFAGTNIGTTILLCRVIQAWQEISRVNGTIITDRVFWGTVYGMALGVNYGAFSAAFSAALAGLLWRDILKRKLIVVRRLEFARVNLPIIAIAMAVGCAVLTGEIYIMRNEGPYSL